MINIKKSVIMCEIWKFGHKIFTISKKIHNNFSISTIIQCKINYRNWINTLLENYISQDSKITRSVLAKIQIMINFVVIRLRQEIYAK